MGQEDKLFRRQIRRKKLWQSIQHLLDGIRHMHSAGNARLSGHRSSVPFTAASLAALILVSVVMLWLPNCLGVANDGTVARTMENAGLHYLEADRANSSDYLTLIYNTSRATPSDRSLQLGLLRLAQAIDNLLTGDQLFDVRFLAGLYLLLALPAWWLLIGGIVSRADAFIEKCVLAAACVLVLGDVSYLTYFNSLYPEALFQIGLGYFWGGCIRLQRVGRGRIFYWLAIVLGAALLCLTRRHCWIFGFGAALYCIFQLRLSKHTLERVGICLCGAAGLLAGLWSLAFVETDFDDTSRIHAMTRGVLFQASNPEKALSEFGIEGSYAMLTDVSLYDTYPAAEESEYYIQNGFLDKYSTADIALYYLRHPGAMVSMLDEAVRSAMNLRRTACGNYLRSAGMPAGANSIFMGAYSVFKARSMPHTSAFPLVLAVLCGVLSQKGWWKKEAPDRFYYVYFCTTLLAFALAMVHLMEIVLLSGDAQLSQYNLIAGYSMDVLLLFTLSELLHRLNILEEAQVKKS